MDESKLRELIKLIVRELNVTDDEDDIEEITTTGDVAGYNTPHAFKKKKKKKKAGFDGGHGKPDVFGFSVVNEELDNKDIKVIRELIRDVISDVLRDIWIKRNTWK